MGRDYTTGAVTCSGCKRIELSYLIRDKILVKGEVVSSVLSWSSNGSPSGSMSIRGRYTEEEKSIQLIYSLTDGSGEKFKYNYKIELVGVPSNLGKGEVLYFVCPDSGERCRVLYSAYGYHKFKSREAYRNRIYYASQICSKLDYASVRKRKLSIVIDEIYDTKRFSYNGKETHSSLRLDRLLNERDRFIDIENRIFMHKLSKLL